MQVLHLFVLLKLLLLEPALQSKHLSLNLVVILLLVVELLLKFVDLVLKPLDLLKRISQGPLGASERP